MKRYLIAATVFLILLLPLQGTYSGKQAFLTTALDIADNTTVTNGVGFTAPELDISRKSSLGSIWVEFDPQATAAVDITFYFNVSYNGTEWTTDFPYTINLPTNTDASGGTVRNVTMCKFYGVKEIRLDKIVVGNGAGACNNTMAYVAY